MEEKGNYIIELVSKDELSAIEAFYLELDNTSSNMSHVGALSLIRSSIPIYIYSIISK